MQVLVMYPELRKRLEMLTYIYRDTILYFMLCYDEILTKGFIILNPQYIPFAPDCPRGTSVCLTQNMWSCAGMYEFTCICDLMSAVNVYYM